MGERERDGEKETGRNRGSCPIDVAQEPEDGKRVSGEGRARDHEDK